MRSFIPRDECRTTSRYFRFFFTGLAGFLVGLAGFFAPAFFLVGSWKGLHVSVIVGSSVGLCVGCIVRMSVGVSVGRQVAVGNIDGSSGLVGIPVYFILAVEGKACFWADRVGFIFSRFFGRGLVETHAIR